ncbi:MAG: GDYXXLXY domain-containing protein [Acidobacteria bacterium]|nr:GDYXXLXY domain-containing protein [Candidatus Sulfomarinibacter sp. MAG AM2]
MGQRLRLALFTVVALVQLTVAGGAIVRSELALRTGEAFRFRIQPVDPVDAFRGRYVAIRFAIANPNPVPLTRPSRSGTR